MSRRFVAIACSLLVLTVFLSWGSRFLMPGNSETIEPIQRTNYSPAEVVQTTETAPTSAGTASSGDGALAQAQTISIEQEQSARPTNGPRLLSRVPAVFPWQASADSLTQGYVDLEYTVSSDGTVQNIVLRESTNNVFNDSAITAVGQYLYQPRFENGIPIESQGVRTRVFFNEAGRLLAEPAEISLERPPVSESGGIVIDSASNGLPPPTAPPQTSVLPVVRMPPTFPESAIEAGIGEGYVVVTFSINESGKPVDISVIETTSEFLNDAAIESVSRSAYLPRFENGEAVVAEGMTTRVEFEAP